MHSGSFLAFVLTVHVYESMRKQDEHGSPVTERNVCRCIALVIAFL